MREQDISGRVVIEGRKPADAPLFLTLTPEPRLSAPVTLNPDKAGAFKIQRISPGMYKVGGSFPGYLKSARIGTQNISKEGLLQIGESANEMEIVISTNGGSLDGRVISNDGSLADAILVLVPEGSGRGRLDSYKVTSPDAQGRFQLDHIAPGEYKAFAWRNVVDGSWYDSDFIKAQENWGLRVSIREGARQSIDLNLQVIP